MSAEPVQHHVFPCDCADLRRLNGDCTAAVVLSLAKLMSPREPGSWFEFPLVFIRKETGMKRDKLDAAISTLVESGILETQRRAGNITWIRLK